MTQTTKLVRIATRKSALALWQAEFVKAKLEHFHYEVTGELVPISKTGEINLETTQDKTGG